MNVSCKQHNLPLSLFCYDCMDYKCELCCTNHSIANAEDVKQYIRSATIKPFKQSEHYIKSIQSQLGFELNQAVQLITLKFNKALKELNEFSDANKELLSHHEINTEKINTMMNSHTNPLEILISNLKNTIKLMQTTAITVVASIQDIIDANFKAKLQHIGFSKKLIIYDIPTKRKTEIMLKTNINPHSETISVYKKIFILGGYNDGYPLSDVHQIDYSNTYDLVPCHSMPIAKYNHSVAYKKHYIYTTGGYDYAALGQCAKYHTLNGNWCELPQLINKRYYHASFIVSDYIYVYGGYGNTELSNIESINLSTLAKWEMINITNPCAARWYVQGSAISKNEAVIFGSSNDSMKKESYIFRIKQNEIECIRSSDLKNGGSFSRGSAPIKCDGRIYCVSMDNELSVYSIQQKEWSVA